jgi:hypothetical protein
MRQVCHECKNHTFRCIEPNSTDLGLVVNKDARDFYLCFALNNGGLMKKIFAASLTAISLLATGISPATAASTHSYVPDPFIPTGDSWVEVAENLKNYLVSDDYADLDDELDDYAIGYLPAGSSCFVNNTEVLEGPSLVDDGNDDCFEAVAGEPTPIPIGFPINFGGVVQTGLFLTSNAAVTFEDSDFYDEPLHRVAIDDQDSGISVLGNDLGIYLGGYSEGMAKTVVWTAQTTIAGKAAFIASWENLSSHGDGNLQASVQLVLLNDGNGDFTAWFNYDKFEVSDQGADGGQIYVDLERVVSPGVYRAYSLAGWDELPTPATEGCFEEDEMDVFSADAESTYSGPDFIKVLNFAQKHVSFFTDSTCTTPFVFEEGSRHLVAQVSTEIDYLPIGWFYFTPDGQGGAEVSATEFFYNLSIDTLVDSGSDPLINKSINTSVAGRFVIGMKGGKTTGDNNDPAPVANCAVAPKPRVTSYNTSPDVVGTGVQAALKKYAKKIKRSECKDLKIVVFKTTPYFAASEKRLLSWKWETVIRARSIKSFLKAELRRIDVTDVKIKAVGRGATNQFGLNKGSDRIEVKVRNAVL